MLKAGVLMPRSSLYPSLALDMLNGLKVSLKQQQVNENVQLIIDNIGFGTNEQEIYTKAEKMILQDDVDLVIAFADTLIAELLQPLFTATDKILLIVNFGANFPQSWKTASSCITLSLNFCLHAKLTGKLAAQKKNKEAANVVSFYDGGYNQCHSMINSHLANGGTTQFNHVTHLRLEEFTLEPLRNFLETNKELETLLCLFSGEQAERFYTEIQVLQQERKLELFVSPMMLDETLHESAAFNLGEVQGFIPWHSSLANEANQVFKEKILEATNKKANYFSLLGWEAGLLLAGICNNAGGLSTAAEKVEAIKSLKFASPRGWLAIDPATHHCYGPSWHAQVSGSAISVTEALPEIEEVWQAFVNEPLLKEFSMWRNTYLCI